MPVRDVREMVAEANASVETLSVAEAVAALDDAGTLFVDVRESAERAAGTIPGSVHAPRGMLEFFADPQSPLHKEELGSGRRLVLFCASGGRSALAAKTLQDMGVTRCTNLLGGFAAWREEGGPGG